MKSLIIWDLDGVLMNRQAFNMAKEISIFELAKYAVLDWKDPRALKSKMFDLLKTLEPKDPASKEKFSKNPVHSDGLELPIVMCEWLTGVETGANILQRAKARMEEFKKQKTFFDNEREAKILEKILEITFLAEKNANNTEPIKETITILSSLAKNPNVHQVILSNMDKATMDALFASPKHKAIFSNFKREDMIISGECGMLKPSPEIFKHLLSKYDKSNYSQYIFIDDDASNVKAGAELGIKGVSVNPKDLGAIKKEVNTLLESSSS